MGGGELKILLVYYHFEVSGGRYYLDAFKRLGHDVRHIGDKHSVKDAWGIQAPILAKYDHSPDIGGWTTGFSTKWDDWTPDLVIACDSMIAGHNYHHPYYIDVPHAVIAIDNHVRNYDGDWAHQFLAHYHGPAYPVDPARKDHTWLPCASDPMFTPSPIAWKDRAYDVACVGVMYPRRVEIIQAMRDAGLKVFAETGLLYDEYKAAYHNARISLCVSAAGDVAQRIFETGRMGCAVLTDPLQDIQDEHTYAQLQLRGYAVYYSTAEAVTIAKGMLEGTQGFEVAAHSSNILPEKMREQMVSIGEGAAAAMAKSCYHHTWDERAKVIVEWFGREYGKDKQVGNDNYDKWDSLLHNEPPIGDKVVKDVQAGQHTINIPFEAKELTVAMPLSKPFLNLGCGRTHLPGERPLHHALVPADIYTEREWVNVDRSANVGADKVFDLFTYPWPLESDSYDGALLSHLCEHIPHEINLSRIIADVALSFDGEKASDLPDKRRATELSQLQDGWFAFFAELYRVLTPGAEVHILSPYGQSTDAMIDPTHTRFLFPHTFQYFIPNPDAPFEYSVGSQYANEGYSLGYSEYASRIMNNPMLTEEQKRADLELAIGTQMNIVREFYIRLKVVK